MTSPICTRKLFETKGLSSPCRSLRCAEEIQLQREYHDRMEKIGREYEKRFRVRLASFFLRVKKCFVHF